MELDFEKLVELRKRYYGGKQDGKLTFDVVCSLYNKECNYDCQGDYVTAAQELLGIKSESVLNTHIFEYLERLLDEKDDEYVLTETFKTEFDRIKKCSKLSLIRIIKSTINNNPKLEFDLYVKQAPARGYIKGSVTRPVKKVKVEFKFLKFVIENTPELLEACENSIKNLSNRDYGMPKYYIRNKQ